MDEIQNKMVRTITDGCDEVLRSVSDEVIQEVPYGFALLSDSSFQSVCPVISTREFLKSMSDETADIPVSYFMVNAYEWTHFLAVEPFVEFQQMARTVLDKFHNESVDRGTVSSYFKPVMVAALEATVCLDSFKRVFCDEVPLIALQFSDADDNERDDVLAISAQINTQSWHDEMVANYE
jgi:hypothetical protein